MRRTSNASSPLFAERRPSSVRSLEVGDAVQVLSGHARGWVGAKVERAFTDQDGPGIEVSYQVDNLCCKKTLRLTSGRLRVPKVAGERSRTGSSVFAPDLEEKDPATWVPMN